MPESVAGLKPSWDMATLILETKSSLSRTLTVIVPPLRNAAMISPKRRPNMRPAGMDTVSILPKGVPVWRDMRKPKPRANGSEVTPKSMDAVPK